MSFSRIPVFVHKAGWEVYAAYLEFLDTDDFERLRVAVTDLGDALMRDPRSLVHAPDEVVQKYLSEATES